MQGELPRPYRSHKYPACEVCRKRKARCLIENPGSACRLCRERKYQCSLDRAGEKEDSCLKGKRAVAGTEGFGSVKRLRKGTKSRSSSIASQNESSVLVNPHMAEDITIVQNSLSTEQPANGHSLQQSQKYTTLSKTKHEAVVSLRVPKRRPGRPVVSNQGFSQLEVLDQVLRGQKDAIIDAFYDKVYSCFPVVPEELGGSSKERNYALLCSIYAISAVYWSSANSLAERDRPDMTFLWNQAVNALNESYLGPNIKTVQASLIAMMGRPVLGIQDNVVDCGRTVALAQGLGLHRNPQQWNLLEPDKQLRVCMWWGVVIHDSWSSLAHGTPPLIQDKCHDVPVPSELTFYHTGSKGGSGIYFIFLCKLTKILASILPAVYGLRDADWETSQQRSSHFRDQLLEWQDELPSSLNPGTQHESLSDNGSSGLWFLYLIMKLLACRLDLRQSILAKDAGLQDEERGQAALNDAACAVSSYVSSLADFQLNEFWLPYTAHLLVLSTTMLLRCTIQSKEREVKMENNWELGEFTLERCEEDIQHLVSQNLADDDESPVPADSATQIRPSNEHGELLTYGWQFADISSNFLDAVWDHQVPFLHDEQGHTGDQDAEF